MKTHKIKHASFDMFSHDFNGEFITYCGLNETNTKEGYTKNLVNMYEECTCANCNKNYKLETEKMDSELAVMMKELEEFERHKEKQRQDIIAIVKEMVSVLTFEDIEQIIEDSDYTYDYKITEEPIGQFQDEEDFEEVKGYWVNQTTNGGYVGDEFAGTISIKLNDTQYLQFSYSM